MLVDFVGCLLLIALLDLAIAALVIDEKARWFFLHSMVNVIIALLSVPSIWSAMSNPLATLDKDSNGQGVLESGSLLPLLFTICIHVYHVLMFNMDKNDVFHHLLFVPVLAYQGLSVDWGCLSGLSCFFICGLPGAVDYALLGLRRIGRCPHLVQKQTCAFINLHVRMPAVVFISGIAYTCIRDGRSSCPAWRAAVQIGLHYINVTYYTRSAIVSEQNAVRAFTRGRDASM